MLQLIALISILILLIYIMNGRESFIDVYSYYLHDLALTRQFWWNNTHRKPFYQNQHIVSPIYKE